MGLLTHRASAYRGAMPVRPALVALIALLPLLLVACTGTRDGTAAPYPALLPLEQILGAPSTQADPSPVLAARGAALRGRAAVLRQQD